MRRVAMPATKSQSKQKRTLRIKQCAGCYKKCQDLLDMAVANERLEFERDVMVGVMASALEHASLDFEMALRRWMQLSAEKGEHLKLLADLQLIQSGCTRELGGSVWIRGEQLAECLNRYTNGRGK
jgi:hypothetical protein